MRAPRRESRRPAARRRARPRRASSGPSSSTEPRSRPTSALSGSSLVTSRHRMRSVVLPMPSTSAPRSSSSRAITSTSAMRGTLVSVHGSSVSRQAAISGSAAFLLPSTSTRPSMRRPPSITSVDMQCRQSSSRVGSTFRSRPDRRSHFASVTPNRSFTAVAAALDERRDLGRRWLRRR